MSFHIFQPIKYIAAALAAGTIALSSSALAHPRLVSSLPVANSTTATTNIFTLTFSEALVPQFSGLSIVMTDMPGKKMAAPMPVGNITSRIAADGKTLIGKLPAALPAGTYKIGWHAVTADTHRVEGSFSFVVK